jgi:lysyl-tRNA synthetase class 2
MGKASFAKLQDRTGQIQIFLQRDTLGEAYEAFKKYDVGDIVGAEGLLMRTRTGELSVRVDRLRLLTKSLRPLPDKFHGLADVEQRYRQRYVDLIVTPEAREVFVARSRIVCSALSVPLYGKLRILELDATARTVTFEILADQNCGYVGLEPGLPDK